MILGFILTHSSPNIYHFEYWGRSTKKQTKKQVSVSHSPYIYKKQYDLSLSSQTKAELDWMSTCRSRSFKKKKRHTVNTVNTNSSYVLTCHPIKTCTKYTCVTIRIKMLERLFSTFAYFEISIMECSRARVCVCVHSSAKFVCIISVRKCVLITIITVC